MRKIFGKIVVLSTILLLLSCDKDFNTIGSEIIGDGEFEFEKYAVQNLKAYSKATGPVQSNNLPINSLGIYQDPFFGTNISNFVTQLELDKTTPNFGIDIEIKTTDSVYLYIPYYSKLTLAGSGSAPNTYVLDSIYGSQNSNMSLKIYESGYYIRDFDSNDPSEFQKYFSNEKNLIENNLIGLPLNGSTDVSQNSEFVFSNQEHIIYKTNGSGQYVNNQGSIVPESERIVKERYAPGMWINLDKNFFFNKILSANSSNLVNQNNFKEFFKGLYFQVEQNSGQPGAMAQLDFSKGFIEIQYHSKKDSSSDLKKNSFKLNLKGNTINFFDFSKSLNYETALSSSNPILGDEYLYVKGGNGSIAFLDLFGETDNDGNGVADELDQLRLNNWLINDAVLTLHIDNRNQKEPRRIFIYDVNNRRPLIDYVDDISSNANPKLNKINHGGVIEIGTGGKGVRYKFKIRGHINKIINGTTQADLKNVKLGIAVTENINNVNFSTLSSPFNVPVFLPVSSSDLSISRIPVSHVMNPLGTILYGSNATDLSKKMKLEIYYTKPN
jgi:hypothetical protein